MRQGGLAAFRHSLYVQPMNYCELGEPEMSTGRRRGAEKWISTLSRIRTSTFESRHLDTQSQFLGATTASGTHLGLSELVISC